MAKDPYHVKEEECEIELDEGAVFSIPSSCVSIPYNDYSIVVNELNGRFLVLYSSVQNSIFADIKSLSTIRVLKKKYADVINELSYVLSAIIDSSVLSEKPAVFDPIERNLYIYVTNQCNLACLHCYRNLTKDAGTPLFLAQWQKILQNFKGLGGQNITISGGEPMLYLDIVKLITFIKSIGLHATVLSNGTKWQEVFARHKPLVAEIDEIQISVDGYDEQSNQLIRRSSIFEEAMSTIEWLLTLGANVSVAVTPHPDLVFSNSHYEKLKSFLADLSKKGILVRLTHKILPNEGIKLSSEKVDWYVKRMVELEENVYPLGRIKKWAAIYETSNREKNCGWGGLTIDASGNAFLCNRIDELKPIGNILSSDLSAIYRVAAQHYTLTAVDNIPTCKMCPIRYLCNGGCRLDNYIDLYGMPNRQCTPNNKKKFYELMVESVKYIYGLE